MFGFGSTPSSTAFSFPSSVEPPSQEPTLGWSWQSAVGAKNTEEDTPFGNPFETHVPPQPFDDFHVSGGSFHFDDPFQPKPTPCVGGTNGFGDQFNTNSLFKSSFPFVPPSQPFGSTAKNTSNTHNTHKRGSDYESPTQSTASPINKQSNDEDLNNPYRKPNGPRQYVPAPTSLNQLLYKGFDKRGNPPSAQTPTASRVHTTTTTTTPAVLQLPQVHTTATATARPLSTGKDEPSSSLNALQERISSLERQLQDSNRLLWESAHGDGVGEAKEVLKALSEVVDNNATYKGEEVKNLLARAIAESQTWVCSVCTYHNNLGMQLCEMCGQQRPNRPATSSTTATTITAWPLATTTTTTATTTTRAMDTTPSSVPATKAEQVFTRLTREQIKALSFSELSLLKEAVSETYDMVSERRWEVEHEDRRKEKGEGECVVCLERPRDTLFAPCNHLCCCGECGGPMRECPLCRKAIVNKVAVYLA